jgi:CII-binding regulator of phage lambda lysogenization HflD
VPEEVATLRLTAKDETAAAFQAAALNLHRVKTATDDFHRTNTEAFERGKRSIELFGMSLERALSIGAIVEFGRRSYEAFANFDRAMTMTRLNTGATQEQMARLSATIEQLQKTTRQTNEELVAGFNTYMQTSGQTFDQAMAIFPKIGTAATATQNDINSVATAIGAAARNLHLSTAQQEQALDQLALAASKNLKDLGQYLPELTNALRGMGATGPEAFQSILSALMTIRGGFGSTADAVGALEQAIRAVTQSRDKGFAALGHEIERRVKEGQDLVVAMMQTLEANNMLSDQALRRFLGRGGPALLALQQLRDLWKQNRENFETLGRAQGEVERRNKAINQDAKTAAESLAVAFHDVLDEVGKFLAVSGVPKALTDTADALHTVNSLIAQIREGVEGKGLDWEKFLGTSGLDRQFEHFQAVWAARWQRLKDFLREGTTPRGQVGRESAEAQRLQAEVNRLEREIDTESGGAVEPFWQYGRRQRALRGMRGRRRARAGGGGARTITGRPYYFSGGGAFPFNVEMQGERTGVMDEGFVPEGYSANIEDRRGERSSRDLQDSLDEVAAELKRLNDFNDAHDPLREGGAPAGAYGFAGGTAGYGAGGGGGLPGIGPGRVGGPGGVTGGFPGGMGAGGGMGGPGGATSGANFLGSAAAANAGIQSGVGQNLTTVQTKAGPITVNRAAADDMAGFVNDLVDAGAPIKDIGSFNARRIAGSGRWSQHAYGGALDIEQRSRNVVSPAFRAWANAHPEQLRQILQRRRMRSGGDWRNPDFGHFEWAGPGGGGREAPGGQDVAGAHMTWFNPRPWSYTDPRTGITWTDTSAQRRGEGYHASGLPISTPGIATVGEGGLGHYYSVTLPDGRVAITRKTDIGPPNTVDINAALASQAYPGGPGAFPSGRGARATARYLGKTLPEGVSEGIYPAGTTIASLQQQRRAAMRQEDGGGDEHFGHPGAAGLAQWRKARAELEKPIRMHIEAPEAPSRFTPRIRRASAANVQNRELHRERERSYADMEE